MSNVNRDFFISLFLLFYCCIYLLQFYYHLVTYANHELDMAKITLIHYADLPIERNSRAN